MAAARLHNAEAGRGHRKDAARPERHRPRRWSRDASARRRRADAFFCDYVMSEIQNNTAYAKVKADLNSVGGLRIYTTLNTQDQNAANARSTGCSRRITGIYNPNNDVDTEVHDPAGHRQDPGHRRGPALRHRSRADHGRLRGAYPVRRRRGGPDRVVQQDLHSAHRAQAGRSVRLQPERDLPGHGRPVLQLPGQFPGHVHAQQRRRNTSKPETFTLYNGTTQSINVFYAQLEQKVGLCNVVKTAVSLGMTRADGSRCSRPTASRTPPATSTRPTTPRRSRSARSTCRR